MREMFHIAALHDIRPIIETLPLEKCNEAIDKLLAGDARYRYSFTYSSSCFNAYQHTMHII